MTYSDGISIAVNGESFTVELSDGTQITYSDDTEAYSIVEADGSTIAKEKDVSSDIVLSSGTNIALQSSGIYVITDISSGVETRNGSEGVESYLTENDYPTLEEYDQQVQDIIDYISEQ